MHSFSHQIFIEHLLCSKHKRRSSGKKKSPWPSWGLYSCEEDKKQIRNYCVCVRKLRHPERIESDRGVFKSCIRNMCMKKLLLKKDLNERKKQWIIWGKSFPSKTTTNAKALRWGHLCHVPEIARRSVCLGGSEVDWHEIREVAKVPVTQNCIGCTKT